MAVLCGVSVNDEIRRSAASQRKEKEGEYFMQHAMITTGRFERPNRIILNEPLPDFMDVVRVIIEPVSLTFLRRKAGALKGLIDVLPGFDEPLEDFEEYMS